MSIYERKIVIFGCQKLAIDIIKYIMCNKGPIGILDNGDLVKTKISAIITHDEERDKLFSDKFVYEYANEQGIQWHRFDDNVDARLISQYGADIAFSIYYRKILKKEVIDLFPMGIINLHPGLLPRDRGPNPTLWVVKRGENKSGTTLHYVDIGMDTGDIIAQTQSFVRNMTGFELNKHMMDVGLKLFKDNYINIICGKNNRIVQSHDYATCNTSFNNNMRYIDWNNTASEISNHIRAFAKPYAGSLTTTKSGNLVVIHKAKILDTARSSFGPGTYKNVDGNIIVQTHSFPIQLESFICDKNIKSGRFVSGIPS
jgi:methionyl-tRNA formyltransferase